MSRLVAAILLLLAFIPQAYACKCLVVGLSERHMAEADTVFVFRVTALALQESGPADPVVGAVTISVIDSLRGRAEHISALQYNAHWCCRLRFELGEYYIAFANSPANGFTARPDFIVRLNVPRDSFEFIRESGRLQEIVSGRRPPADLCPLINLASLPGYPPESSICTEGGI
jgi:hypothetical protein